MTPNQPSAMKSSTPTIFVPHRFIPQQWVPRLVAAWLVAVCLVLVACAETVAISRLLSDPAHWNNKEVHIQGHVINSMGMMGEGAYRVDDGTGSIWVISNTGVPGRGARVDVIGTVFQGAEFMGHSYGVALRERGHRSK